MTAADNRGPVQRATPRPRLARLLTTCLLAGGWAAAHAGGGSTPPGATAAYEAECASCHIAYPPAMLPARSWQRLVAGLDAHFGTDASSDAATVQWLGTWLQARAGTGRRAAEEPPHDRITRSAWFERKHRKIEPAVWTLPDVRSPAHCAACHAGADRGRFDDDDLRIPAGLNGRQRRAWND